MLEKPNHWTISIENVSVLARVGILDWERQTPQRLTVCARILVPLEAMDNPSSISHVADYDAFLHSIFAIAERGHIDLIESYALLVMETCFSDPLAVAAEVSIEKVEVHHGKGVPRVSLIMDRAEWTQRSLRIS